MKVQQKSGTRYPKNRVTKEYYYGKKSYIKAEKYKFVRYTYESKY